MDMSLYTFSGQINANMLVTQIQKYIYIYIYIDLSFRLLVPNRKNIVIVVYVYIYGSIPFFKVFNTSNQTTAQIENENIQTTSTHKHI